MTKPSAAQQAKRGDARPGRRELPVEQHVRQPPERRLLPRQRAGEAREHALDRHVVGRRRLGAALERGIEKVIFVHLTSSLSITLSSARRMFCLPRTSNVSTADTEVSRISATCALLMPSP